MDQLQMTALKSKLQLFILNSLKNININNNKSIQKLLKIVNFILVSFNDQDQIDENDSILDEFQLEFKAYSKASLKAEFKNNFYSICLTQLLTNFNPNLYSSTNSADDNNNNDQENYKSTKDLFVSVISNARSTDTFNVLYDMSLTLSPSRQRDFCVFLMSQFLRRHLMRGLFVENISNLTQSGQLVENELVQRVVNLPDKFTAFLMNIQRPVERKNDIFMAINYFKIVSADLWSCLSSELNRIESLGFVANVFGKICFLGYSDLLNETFLKNLIKHSYVNEKWQAISRDLIASTSANYLESILLNLINFSSSHQDMNNLLGDLVLTNSNVRYFLLDKFIFLKVFKKDKPVQNLIGYLHESPTRRVLYYELFKKLLNSWSTKASIVNTSHEQHVYLTKCILVCVSFMDTNDKSALVNDLLISILNGVQKHLCSPLEQTRTLGMIVGENLMNDLAWAERSEDLKRLKFEYEETDEVKWLVSLRTRPNTESIFKPKTNLMNESQLQLDALESLSLAKSTEGEEKAKMSTLFENNQLNIKITQTDKDSDDDDDEDDLIPYDLSNDVPLVKTNQPAYLRDCLDALIYADDPDKIEVTLKSVEKLCETYHFELEEICVELVKVLLHKSNSYSIEKFDELKSNAMISVTVHYPVECGQYLASQFYEQNYSFSQRTEILHVLAMSAQKLSSPNEEPIFDKRTMQVDEDKKLGLFPNLIAFNQRPVGDGFEWRDAVQKRIEAKTKIKKSAKTSEIKQKSKENKYSNVYGHFFFPLLNPFDK